MIQVFYKMTASGESMIADVSDSNLDEFCKDKIVLKLTRHEKTAYQLEKENYKTFEEGYN